ncbi:hypothetical protein FRZ67_00880 [Panacibacter ginsenosidivorans]|uniref:Lipoprotein n=1 Tax=Panacibacter ginsenosidivorans TaxID=1813871 RepID=A0A5B8V3H2_9BACT|nr:hypothetical protein [Panacibacter ginsenosidivorans]QEC65924.1 hypothetical protein FRZ67_00880 [Panacibacter ginsenosidivorans]
MKYIFCLFFITVTLLSCGSDAKKSEEQTYTEQKESLEQKEKKNPLHFINVTGDNKKNIIGQTVIRGILYNKATVVAYKDVRIKMLCYKNGKMVEEHEDVINDVIKPNSEKEFKTRYRLPKGTDSINLSVMSAIVAESK